MATVETKTPRRGRKRGNGEKFDVYQAVTDKIVAALEEGTVPWRKPWRDGEHRNVISKRPYRGINQMLLEIAGFEQPWWITMKKANELGGKVRKGERATMVTFWKRYKCGECDGGKQPGCEKCSGRGSWFFLRYYNVFNVEQIDGLPDGTIPPVEEREHEPLVEADALVSRYANTPTGPSMEHKGNRAAYAPALDHVMMPPAKMFESSVGYYSTLFHELVHSTGHKSRLNRDEVQAPAFGTEPYAREELVAEVGAAMLCAAVGMENDPQQTKQNAAYIKSWLGALRDDNKLVVSAAARAQRAADLIRGTEFDNGEGDS